jgi:hypothetical protein
MSVLLVDFPDHQGIVLDQGRYKALICMDYGADGDFF